MKSNLVNKKIYLVITFPCVKNVFGLDNFLLVIISQNVHQTASVPVIGDSASVIDVPRCVRQNLERNVIVLHHEHVQLRYANFQVSVRKFVRYVEAQGAELPSLQERPVKEAQGEEQPLEGKRLGVVRVDEVDEIRHLVGVGSQHVRLDASRGFHGHLAPVLEDRYGKMGGGGGSQPDSEVAVYHFRLDRFH